MARDSTASVEIEASSFSVWNCVITFLQILLISTMLYGAGWTQASGYNLTPENLFSYQNFKAIAFFFSVWALQSIALALLLIWAVGKKSYSLCHSWLMSEALMQVFIIVSIIYFAYRSILTTKLVITNGPSPLPLIDSKSTYQTQTHQYEFSFRPPKHLTFLAVLHFIIKGFGFWIVGRYMNTLTSDTISISDLESMTMAAAQSRHDTRSNRSSRSGSRSRNTRQVSPPPSYAVLCKDDLPCYDEALKLCLKDNITTETEGLPQTNEDQQNNANDEEAGSMLMLTQDDASKDLAKTPLVITE